MLAERENGREPVLTDPNSVVSDAYCLRADCDRDLGCAGIERIVDTLASQQNVIDPPAAPRSAEDGTAVEPHRGSIVRNAFRDRWIAVFTQKFGKPSAFGEIWYAEATSPFGPWGPAVKVLTHDNHTFYNPKIHAELTPGDAPFIVFEGTYTAEFADHAVPTPRHNYNQILYRLDLDDPALAPAQK